MLARRAREQGWLVFDDRIIDSDGVVRACTAAQAANASEDQEIDVRRLCEPLRDSERLAVQSWWLVVAAFGFSETSAGYKDAYARLEEMIRGAKGDRAEEQIRQLYATKLPKRDTWRTMVARAAKALGGTPAGRMFLHSIGLPKWRRCR